MKEKLFATEADLVAAFCGLLECGRRNGADDRWTAYHETAGWDLLLVGVGGVQIGIEAKLSLNAKVLDQALDDLRYYNEAGPDFRAVLVPRGGAQNHLNRIAKHLGIVVLQLYDAIYRRSSGEPPMWMLTPQLPRLGSAYGYSLDHWPNWCPASRCALPDYVPDVTGGKAAPVALTHWKVKAIKLLILLERRGFVTRRDMKLLQISPTRWTDHHHGFLTPGAGGYVRCGRTPDLKAQHPKNWAEIEADFAKWSAGFETPGGLNLGGAG